MDESKYIDVLFSIQHKNLKLYITRPTEYELFYDVVIAGSIFRLWLYKRRHKIHSKIIFTMNRISDEMTPCMVLDTFDTLMDARRYVENILDGVM